MPKIPKTGLLLIFLTLSASFAQAQPHCDSLLPSNAKTLAEWQALLAQQYQSAIKQLGGDYVSEKKALYKERYDLVAEHFAKAELVTDTAVTRYMAKVLAKIISGNPDIALLKPSVYLSRSGWPNAYTAGYNTIFFNAGLFTRINTEAQLAFILSHELAHIVLRHNDKSIDKYLGTIMSKEFKAEVAAIKKQQFGQGKALEELTKTFSFDTRKHSRFSEKDADGQAIAWMRNAGYSLGQAVDCLALLDSVDNDICDTKLAFQKHLSFEEYPYKPSYFGTARRSVFGAAAYTDDKEAQRIKDSLSTHPDCKLRVQYANGLIAGSVDNAGNNFLVDESFFYALQHRLKNEIIDFTLHSDKVSRGLFYALEQLWAGNQSPLVPMKISEAFTKLYTAQKNHTLGKITDLPDPQHFSASYNALLYYIQNASLSDFASVNYYFTSYYIKKYPTCKQMANCMANCAANMERKEEAAHWTNIYEQL